jgi:hypothetical protein
MSRFALHLRISQLPAVIVNTANARALVRLNDS